MLSAQNMWDFWTLLPEALHQVTITMSNRGIPRSFRHMHGFAAHAYSLINAAGEVHWVKFTLRTQQGIANITDEEAAAVIGWDRESHQRDLSESIGRGEYPRWKMYVQVMSGKQALAHPFNPFDVTKVWPHGAFPLLEVGEIELDRNPQNVFADAGGAAARWYDNADVDDYQQPRELFRRMSHLQRQTLFDNTARAMRGVAAHIRDRHIDNCAKVDAAYGEGLARAIQLLGS